MKHLCRQTKVQAAMVMGEAAGPWEQDTLGALEEGLADGCTSCCWEINVSQRRTVGLGDY